MRVLHVVGARPKFMKMAARAMELLRRAASLDEDSLSAQWALGRAALASGDWQIAANALEPFVAESGRSPLSYYGAMTAFSPGGQPEEVVALYESVPAPQSTQATSDVVALAHLDIVAGE